MATAVTNAVGTPAACGVALAIVVGWAVCGPVFGFAEAWQLFINTTTTIATFLMVFVIQQSQNKDSVAVHLKLNELLASHPHASNRLISIEDFDHEELMLLHRFYLKLARLAEQEAGVTITHSPDEAERRHARKRRGRPRRH